MFAVAFSRPVLLIRQVKIYVKYDGGCLFVLRRRLFFVRFFCGAVCREHRSGGWGFDCRKLACSRSVGVTWLWASGVSKIISRVAFAAEEKVREADEKRSQTAALWL